MSVMIPSHDSIKDTACQEKRSFSPLEHLKARDDIDFYILDVETANQKVCSICQIGVVGFSLEGQVQSWGSYLDPEDTFSGWNIAVHAITPELVKGSPAFPILYKALKQIENCLVVQHTGFDKASLAKACRKYGLPVLEYRWLDSALVAKRTWESVSRRGFGLGDLAERFGFSFVHHDAVEDALVTGEILLKAVADSGRSPEEWVKAVKKPLKAFYGP